ncbi:MAG TPA: hypothetical protein VN939_02830 [Chthoniobacterales bacterium]|jgi:hypothetical protein|nr:hypothetical protein [Chthoniobacterales bacterium]
MERSSLPPLPNLWAIWRLPDEPDLSAEVQEDNFYFQLVYSRRKRDTGG